MNLEFEWNAYKAVENLKNHRVEPMKKEYEFTGVTGVRGKCHKAYRKGHTVTVHNEDGTAAVLFFPETIAT